MSKTPRMTALFLAVVLSFFLFTACGSSQDTGSEPVNETITELTAVPTDKPTTEPTPEATEDITPKGFEVEIDFFKSTVPIDSIVLELTGAENGEIISTTVREDEKFYVDTTQLNGDYILTISSTQRKIEPLFAEINITDGLYSGEPVILFAMPVKGEEFHQDGFDFEAAFFAEKISYIGEMPENFEEWPNLMFIEFVIDYEFEDILKDDGTAKADAAEKVSEFALENAYKFQIANEWGDLAEAELYMTESGTETVNGVTAFYATATYVFDAGLVLEMCTLIYDNQDEYLLEMERRNGTYEYVYIAD